MMFTANCLNYQHLRDEVKVRSKSALDGLER